MRHVCSSACQLPYEFQLSKFLICLEYWLFCKKFTQDTAVKQFSKIPSLWLSVQNDRNFIFGLFSSLLGFYPNSYPQLQTSIAGVYLSSPRRSSGGRYHNVITLLVYGRLSEGGKREDYHFNTITLLKKNDTLRTLLL